MSGGSVVRRDEKVTFYCSTDALLRLERAKVGLREKGVKADRGAIVRAALEHVLSDDELLRSLIQEAV